MCGIVGVMFAPGLEPEQLEDCRDTLARLDVGGPRSGVWTPPV